MTIGRNKWRVTNTSTPARASLRWTCNGNYCRAQAKSVSKSADPTSGLPSACLSAMRSSTQTACIGDFENHGALNHVGACYGRKQHIQRGPFYAVQRHIQTSNRQLVRAGRVRIRGLCKTWRRSIQGRRLWKQSRPVPHGLLSLLAINTGSR